MYVIEIHPAQSPLKPGERGMKTNGPPMWWFRVNKGEWMPCSTEYRSGFKLKEKLVGILMGISND